MSNNQASNMTQDEQWMQRALVLAAKAEDLGEVPVGALVVLDDTIIGEGYNQPISECDPTAHAEIIALRQASKTLGNYRLNNATLYVTLEPCSMCAGAMVHSRIKRLVFGATEPKAGAAMSQQRFFEHEWVNHRVEVDGGVCQAACSDLLKTFFAKRRSAKR